MFILSYVEHGFILLMDLVKGRGFPIIMFFLALSLSEARSAIAVMALKLNVAESRTLTINDSGEWNLSRRGVVDLLPISATSIRLTGLRKGFVLLKLVGPDGSIQGQWNITVGSTSKEVTDSREWPAWICTERAVACIPEGLIRGRVPSISWLSSVLSYCAQSLGCSLDVDIPERIVLKWLQELPEGEFEIDRIHRVNRARYAFIVDCGESKRAVSFEQTLNKLSGGLVSAGYFQLLCRAEGQRTHFLARFRVLLVRSDWAKVQGFVFNNGAFYQSSGKVVPGNIWMHLSERGSGIDIIGEPIFHTRLGQSAEAHSGGEFGSHSLEGFAAESGKIFAMHLKVQADAIYRDGAAIEFDLELTTPNSRGQNKALTQNRLVGQSHLAWDRDIFLGALNLDVEGAFNFHVPVLSKIPIFGPLFRMNAGASSGSHALLLGHLNKL